MILSLHSLEGILYKFPKSLVMHRIVKSHLESFVSSFGFASDDEATQFEKFVNYSIISSRVAGQFDIDEVTTSESDDGTDGIAILIDEEIIVSDEDAREIFGTDKRNHEVEIIFTQSKRSESFDLGDYLKFKESIFRFVNSDNYNVSDDLQNSLHNIFDIILKNVPKIRNGKPSIVIRFVCTGLYRKPDALENAKRDFEQQLYELGLFQNIDIKFVDRDELTALWVSSYSGISAKLEMFSNAPLPTIDGIDEAYLAVVKAKSFVENLLISEDGNLRTQVFEENVRSFLGLDNLVNHSISETINSGQSSTRFPVLNNGITIVSSDVRVQGNILHLENFQIVNGCQTSNVLYENRASLNDNIMVNLKVVETSNEDVFSELVRATNSQTKVDETQFLSLRPIVRKIEQYFNTYEGSEGRIYFERRDRQYVGREIPAIRIFPVHTATKCVAAMYCQRPDLAFRYTKTMYEELTDVIFADDVKESIFYSSCLSLYRLHLLASNNIIPQNIRRFKWHILPLVRALIGGKGIFKLNSRQVDDLANKIIDIMAHHNDQVVKIFTKATSIIQSLGNISDDRLKRQAVFSEMMEKID